MSKTIKEATKTVFIRNNDMILINQISSGNNDLFKLDAGFYAVEWSKDLGFYLRTMEVQTLPSKTYGEVHDRAELILTKFQKRQRHTGVLLSGMRGTGKSLLARKVCIDAVEKHGMPVITITSPFSGFSFNNFLEQIKQPCVINVDEFEKVYGKQEDKDPQEELLSMFEGGAQHNKLWLLTINETKRMNEYMQNRPGRIFYHFQYSSLPEETIIEVCKDKGLTQDKIDNLLSFAGLVKEFTFDVLTSIIEECQDFDLMPSIAVRRLNVLVSSATELRNPIIELYADNKLLMSKVYNSFDTQGDTLYLPPFELKSKNAFKFMLGFNPDFEETYKNEDKDGDDFSFNEYAFQSYEIEFKSIEGKNGVREYVFKNLLDVGSYKETMGMPLPELKIIVYPSKKKEIDEFSMACGYFEK